MHATVHLTHPISDDDLERFSRENPGWQVERHGTGSLVMSPFGAAYVMMIDPYERTSWSEGSPRDGFRLDLETIFEA